MTDDLQAEIDRERGRFRVFFRHWRIRHNKSSFYPEDFELPLARHMVANRAVELQNDTRVLVEAATIKPREDMSCRWCGDFCSAQECQPCLMRLSMMPRLVNHLVEVQAALEPFAEPLVAVPPWTNYTPRSGIHETSR